MNRFSKENWYKSAQQDDSGLSLFDPGRFEDTEERKTKKPIEILKLTLRTLTNSLVAIDVGDWVLPDKWTIDLSNTIEKMIREAIGYNSQYLNLKKQYEEGQQLKSLPDLPEHQQQTTQTNNMVDNLINDISKEIKR